MKTITIVNDELGEWEALYIDGQMFAEAHSLSSKDWIDLIINQSWVNNVEYKTINNDKYGYGYQGYNDQEPEFHFKLCEYEDDDFI